MADFRDVKNKVERILTNNFTTQLGADGEYFVRAEATGAIIRGIDMEMGVLVHIRALVLSNVPITPELLLEVATSDFMFGSLRLAVTDNDLGFIWMEHNLLGDFLDEQELVYATIAVGMTADDIDDVWQQRFGGNRAIDGQK